MYLQKGNSFGSIGVELVDPGEHDGFVTTPSSERFRRRQAFTPQLIDQGAVPGTDTLMV